MQSMRSTAELHPLPISCSLLQLKLIDSNSAFVQQQLNNIFQGWSSVMELMLGMY